MSVLSAIQNACSVIGLTKPDAVYSSTAREHFELQVLANTCGDHIAKDYEWQELKALATISGDDSTTAFSLPSDYDRMLKDAKLWSDRLITPLTHVTSTDEWLELDIRQFDFVVGAWTLLANQINIKPAPITGESIKYYYMVSKWALDEASSAQPSFTADSDTFRLSEKLLELCIIWKWRAQKGLPYAQDQDNYENEKEKLITRNQGSRILTVGRPRISRGAQIAYPVPITP